MKTPLIFSSLLIACIVSGCAVAPPMPQSNDRPERTENPRAQRTENRRARLGDAQRPAPDLNGRRAAGTAAQKPPVADDVNPAQTSEDPTFGYSKENPVKLGSQREDGASSSYVFLRQLRDKSRLPFKFVRIGNVGAGEDGHIVDLYKLTDSGGAEFKIFIDMYHPDSNPLDCKAPKGMFIAQ